MGDIPLRENMMVRADVYEDAGLDTRLYRMLCLCVSPRWFGDLDAGEWSTGSGNVGYVDDACTYGGDGSGEGETGEQHFCRPGSCSHSGHVMLDRWFYLDVYARVGNRSGDGRLGFTAVRESVIDL